MMKLLLTLNKKLFIPAAPSSWWPLLISFHKTFHKKIAGAHRPSSVEYPTTEIPKGTNNRMINLQLLLSPRYLHHYFWNSECFNDIVHYVIKVHQVKSQNNIDNSKSESSLFLSYILGPFIPLSAGYLYLSILTAHLADLISLLKLVPHTELPIYKNETIILQLSFT